MAYWRLREIAEPQRWNARKIALATGLAYNTVWVMWANRSKRADLDTLDTLARLLAVAPGELIGAGTGPGATGNLTTAEE
jgi:DNA-binding Xre family transcriptional regulator